MMCNQINLIVIYYFLIKEIYFLNYRFKKKLNRISLNRLNKFKTVLIFNVRVNQKNKRNVKKGRINQKIRSIKITSLYNMKTILNMNNKNNYIYF